MNNSLINKAIKLACDCHEGQLDKAGQPYILHPLRLLFKFESTEEMLVAILHDVIEDSNLTFKDLKNLGFEESIIEAIDCLTKKSGEKYSDFIQRVLHNNLARKVKIEDIKDNLNLCRLNSIDGKDLERIVKYHAALKLLEKN